MQAVAFIMMSVMQLQNFPPKKHWSGAPEQWVHFPLPNPRETQTLGLLMGPLGKAEKSRVKIKCHGARRDSGGGRPSSAEKERDR